MEMDDRTGGGVRRDDERGQGMIEYGLILVLIAVAVLLLVQVLGHQTNNLFSNISSSLGT